MIVHHAALRRDSHGSDMFRIERVRPGRGMTTDGDLGLGPLGAFDHAFLKPGMVVEMHEHRNDEIVSYLRRGTMHHVDTLGNRVPLTPTQFSVMNAGVGMQHEESVPDDGGDVELLQIFVRPRSDDLDPGFQQHTVDSARSPDGWRLLVGPEQSDAPLTVRNRVWIHDAFLGSGSIQLPRADGLVTWLYVFDGSVLLDGRLLQKGDGAALRDEPSVTIECQSPADLVCFLVDMSAPASRSGTLSG